MRRISMLFNFILANQKRLLHTLPHLFATVILIFAMTGTCAYFLSGYLYTEASFSAIRIGYYLPEDSDRDINQLAIQMLKELDSMKETVSLVQVESPEVGYKMLENKDILYLIVVPEHFLTGILDSTNPPLELVVYDTTSLSSYIINELFLSYAGLLGTAQAGIYSGLDTMRLHNYDKDTIDAVNTRVNLVFLDRVMNKSNYIATADAKNAGAFSLAEQYIALTCILTLCFTAFLLIPCLQGCGNGIIEALRVYRLHTGHRLLANTITTLSALYLVWIPCFIGIGIWTKKLHLSGLIEILPALFLLALFIAGTATFTKQTFSANLFVLFTVLLLAYCGGGLLPDAMLPSVVRDISQILPGRYLLQIVCHALF